jgi:hypothetical protein
MSFLVNPYSYSTGCGDADAVAFLAAAGITDATITSAVCTLVTNMKINGTWSNCSAIYPFVGGTATTHKFNLKNPADTNAAFRLLFSGGWTHSANGILGNALNTFANTFYNTNPIASGHLSIYSRSNLATAQSVDLGAGSIAADRYYITAGLTNTNSPTAGFGNPAVASTGSALGFFTGTIISNTSRLFKNGIQLNTSAVLISTNISTLNIGRMGGANSLYTNRQLAFATIGSGLTPSEVASMYTDVQAFQTTLSRQV